MKLPKRHVFAYVLQAAILLLLVFIVPFGRRWNWVIAAYILVSLVVVRVVLKRLDH